MSGELTKEQREELNAQANGDVPQSLKDLDGAEKNEDDTPLKNA